MAMQKPNSKNKMTPVELKKLKEKIADVKQLWKNSKTSETSGSVTVSKDELGFK